METTAIQTLKTWNDLIEFVLMTIMRNKKSEDSASVEVAYALIDCEDMKGSEIRAAKYHGHGEGEEFLMPLPPANRIRLQDFLLKAKNSASAFVTRSRNGEKLIWSVSPAR